MIFVCGADKLIIGCVHQIPNAFDLTGNIVYKFLWCYTGLLGLDLNLLAMLIGSGLETHIIPLHPFKTGNAVCQHSLVRISNMGLA